MDVFLTADIEIWCNGWQDIDSKFESSFQKYIYGKTPSGEFGLAYQLELLNKHNLSCTFFVEPLFAARFGLEPLAKIVSLIQDAGQHVELHLHTEWLDEATVPIIAPVGKKIQHIRELPFDDQVAVIQYGKELLYQAGAKEIHAFRAGSFAFNTDTLAALSKNHITYDCSYNASYFGLESGVRPSQVMNHPFEYNGVIEYPMSVFRDATGNLRHAQLGACSYREMEHLLWQSVEHGMKAFVILFHNFELLNQSKTEPDWVNIKRMKKLFEMLDTHRATFHCQNFKGKLSAIEQQHPNSELSSSGWQTYTRMAEQIYRRKYG